ncbi:MFS transporter [Neofusicoccum parvum]|uniref:MFS transporter n=1 Tax=Neofusicoccum parvum TaxID=310453 RepID=A0ACB5S938_9PEZI|nr:MFS transporter [Neofusicoccum parvum]
MSSSPQPFIQLPPFPPASLGGGDASNLQQYLIFFIPGQPGPVAYYRTFLASLHDYLSHASSLKEQRSAQFEIFARNLSGIDEELIANGAASEKPASSETSMSGEIQGAETALLERVRALTAEQRDKPTNPAPLKVLLVGHGAGAYVALEVLKRWQSGGLSEKGNLFDVAGTVCLFPSVQMKTVAGTVSQAVLSTLSSSALLVHKSVKFLLFLVPSRALETLIKTTTGLSNNTIKVTSEMIGSEWGVYHALKLWRSQMEDQKNGRWDDAICNSTAAARPPTYMLFSQNDGEPAIGRGQGKLEPIAGIPASQLPDSFFTTQEDSESVAGLVKEYVEEIVRLDKRA